MVSMEGRAWAAGYINKKTPGVPGPVGSFWINNSSKTLNWTKPATDGGSPITQYGVHVTSTDRTTKAWVPAATDTTLTLTGLPDKQKYTGYINAVNKNGAGPVTNFSGELGYPAAANKPALSGASATSMSLALTPNPADTDLTLTWDVQYRVGTGAWTTKSDVGTAPVLSGLTAATAYEIQCRASNVNGIGAWSASLTTTTPDATVRAPVVTLVEPIDFGCVVEWTYSGTVEPNKFRIKAVEGTNTTMADVDAPNTDGTVGDLKNGTEYTISVAAIDGSGTVGAWSNTMKVTPATPAFNPPKLDSAVGGDGIVTFSFTPLSSLPDGLTLKHYSWEAVSGVGTNENKSGYVPAGQSQNVVAPDIPNDLDWDFRLYTVVNEGGGGMGTASDPSNSIRVHTEKPIPPYKPRLIGAQIDSGNAGYVDVSFAPGVSHLEGDLGPADITAWQVQLKAEKDSSLTTYDIPDGSARSYRTADKVALGGYTVSVRAKNAVGWSNWSNEVYVKYQPTDNRPFTADNPFSTWESATYYYAIFDPGNDPGKGWNVTWSCTRTATGQNLPIDVCVIGAGGGGKGQTLTLAKGGDGGGGEITYGFIPASTENFTVLVGIGGSTAIDPNNSVVKQGSTTITANAGKSATNATDASGNPRVAVRSDWLDCSSAFGWLIPDSQSVGGTAVAGKQGYPNGLGWGCGGAGTKTNNGGKGVEGLVILRWSKASVGEDVPEPKKEKRKWFGRRGK